MNSWRLTSHYSIFKTFFHFQTQAAVDLGKMSLSAAMRMGNIVKTKIEEEIHKHQHHEETEASSDAVGGEDVTEGGHGDGTAGGEAFTKDGVSASPGRGEGYFSDESTSASPR